MKRSKVIGVTGGIGAGKSRVIRWLSEHFSLFLIEADQVGAELMEPGKAVYSALLEAYGEKILAPDRTIDKKALSAIAFSSDEAQDRVNAIEHPLICDEIRRRIKSSHYKFILLEAALLKGGGLVPDCDEVWYVRADKETRIERLMTSRGYSREKCETFLALQLQDEDFLSFADVTIDNGGDFEKTKAALLKETKRLGMRRKRGTALCR